MVSTAQYQEAVKTLTKNIYRFLMKSLKDEDAAKDIVQDVFLKLWENRKSIKASKIKSWLFTVAQNTMINYLKTSNRQESLEKSGMENSAYQSQNFDVKLIVDKALDELPPLQKSIILLRDLEGYNYKEIAEILDLNESQVKVYLFRARTKIKNKLKSLMYVL